MKRILLAALLLAIPLAAPAHAAKKPSKVQTQTCKFEDLPPMRIERRDAVHYTLRVGNSVPVPLNVGSQFAIAEYQGQEMIFWTQGVSVEINGVVYKGKCK